ncbi:MAG: protein-tyrosine phosphatase [Yoonia sp.]|jgi:protein-tyrosine phosphatase
MSDFTIYEVAMGSGVIALSPMPGLDGDFVCDMRDVIAWQPDLVVTLVEQAELAAKGAAGLGASLAQASVDWRHMPMVDFGTPSVDDGPDWDDVIANAVTRLSDGGRVLVHCRGGCGRSGMAVLRIMIAAGEDADAALMRLRTARPCAIETAAQMQWARTA